MGAPAACPHARPPIPPPPSCSKLGVPTRRSNKTGWTPEEVRRERKGEGGERAREIRQEEREGGPASAFASPPPSASPPMTHRRYGRAQMGVARGRGTRLAPPFRASVSADGGGDRMRATIRRTCQEKPRLTPSFRIPPPQDEVLRRAVNLHGSKEWKKIGESRERERMRGGEGRHTGDAPRWRTLQHTHTHTHAFPPSQPSTSSTAPTSSACTAGKRC